MKKILFVMPQLGSGGAERVVLNILNNLDREVFSPSLILINQKGSYYSELKTDIDVTILNKKVRFSGYKLYKAIKRKKPDIIFSSIRGTSLLIMLLSKILPSNIKYVYREMNTPTESLNNIKYKSLMRFFYNNLEKNADVIICQSNYMIADFIDNFNYDSRKLIQIYNPVDTNYISSMIKQSKKPYDSDNLNIVSIGRLNDQKNHEKLIKSIPILVEKFPNAHVHLLGEGKLENELNELVKKLGLESYVTFVGFVDNPYSYLYYSDLYILHSNYEGLPNVLLEAIFCETPVITTNHPGGTKEILELTNQKHRMVNILNWDEQWFDKPSASSKELLIKFFNKDTIMKQYNDLLERI